MKIPEREALLLSRWEAGEPAALQELCALYGPPLYGFVFCVFGRDGRVPRALAVSAFVHALCSPFRNDKPFLIKGLLFLSAEMAAQPALAEPAGEKPRDGDVFLCALARLSWQDRFLILLRDQLWLSYEEIAVVMRRAEDRAKAALHEARLRFRESLISFSAVRDKGPA